MNIPVSMILLTAVLLLPVPEATAADAPHWEQLAQHGDIPEPLWEAGASFSRSGSNPDLVFRFGGQVGVFPDDPLRNDFYVLDLSTHTWTDLTADDTPAARADTIVVPGPCGNCVSIAGGRGRFRTGADLMFPQMWTYHINSGQWQQASGNTLGDPLAIRRSSAAVVTVPDGNHPNKRVAFAFGGVGNTLSGFARTPGGLRNDVAVYDGSGWSVLETFGTAPAPRAWATGAYDPGSNALLFFGGYRLGPDQGPQTPPFELFGPTNYAGDLWSLSLDTLTWTELDPQGPRPSPRDNVPSLFDTASGGLVIFGGQAFDAIETDLWFYSVSDDTWTEVALAPSSPVPPARVGAVSFVRETPTAFELYLHGGSTSDGGPAVFLDDLWKLTWPKG